MRNILFICILAGLLCFSACSAPLSDTPDQAATAPTNSSVSESTPTEPAESAPIEPGYFPIHQEPAEFVFSSGADTWKTIMEINRDGTFTGQYKDSEMGSSGEGYKATCYVCDFTGVFANVEKVNSYTYKVELIDISTVEPVGKEWIENEIRYIASYPYGLYDAEGKQACEEFIVYLPHTPVSELPEEFLAWCPYEKDTLSCYGLLNTTTNDGFFYMPEA